MYSNVFKCIQMYIYIIYLYIYISIPSVLSLIYSLIHSFIHRFVQARHVIPQFIKRDHHNNDPVADWLPIGSRGWTNPRKTMGTARRATMQPSSSPNSMAKSSTQVLAWPLPPRTNMEAMVRRPKQTGRSTVTTTSSS